MQKTQLTKEGFDKLQAEQKELEVVKKPQSLDRLQKARAMGDLKENSEYSAAKEELAFVEGRIREIDEILKNAEIVQNSSDTTSVTLGNTVSVESKENGKQTFSIVGEFEADPINKKLSQGSPIGRALLGRKIGEEVDIEIPNGKATYKILEIS